MSILQWPPRVLRTEPKLLRFQARAWLPDCLVSVPTTPLQSPLQQPHQTVYLPHPRFQTSGELFPLFPSFPVNSSFVCKKTDKMSPPPGHFPPMYCTHVLACGHTSSTNRHLFFVPVQPQRAAVSLIPSGITVWHTADRREMSGGNKTK